VSGYPWCPTLSVRWLFRCNTTVPTARLGHSFGYPSWVEAPEAPQHLVGFMFHRPGCVSIRKTNADTRLKFHRKNARCFNTRREQSDNDSPSRVHKSNFARLQPRPLSTPPSWSILSIRASVWRVLLGADRIGRPRPDLDLAIGPFDPNLDRARIYQAETCRERDLGGVTPYSDTHQAI